jgi:hypothetical protein
MDQNEEFLFDSIYKEVLSFSEFKLLIAQYKRAVHETMYRLKQPNPFFSIQYKDNRSNSAYGKTD